MEACSYIVAPAIIEGVKRYGIAILKQINGEWIQTYEINDICTDESEISRLVERCNNFHLSECHLMDVIEDIFGEIE